MLILIRRETEEIRIGDEITVAVLGIKSHSVRLANRGPETHGVDGEEVLSVSGRRSAASRADPKRTGEGRC